VTREAREGRVDGSLTPSALPRRSETADTVHAGLPALPHRTVDSNTPFSLSPRLLTIILFCFSLLSLSHDDVSSCGNCTSRDHPHDVPFPASPVPPFLYIHYLLIRSEPCRHDALYINLPSSSSWRVSESVPKSEFFPSPFRFSCATLTLLSLSLLLMMQKFY
jgi:hypothetical protein